MSGARVDLRQLKNFLVVAKLQNINRAALRLHIAQPALSRQIQHLEEELGAKLFEREGKKIRLSEEGAIFLEDARATLAQLDAAKIRVAMATKGMLGILRIGFHQVSGRHAFVSEAIQRFHEASPAVAIQIVALFMNFQPELIRTRALDVGIMYRAYATNDLASLTIASDGWCVALPRQHRLARSRVIRLGDLEGEPFISLTKARAPRQLEDLHAACQTGGLTPKIVQEVEQESTLLHLVAAGMGIGLVTDTGFRPDKVVVKKVKDLSLRHELCVVWRHADERSVLRRFIDALALVAPSRTEPPI